MAKSLPVSETVKTRAAHVDAWIESLHALAAEGISTICYNFMQVLDWTRTDLAHEVATGATCMRFDLANFAALDLVVLERDGAEADYDDALRAEARSRAAGMDAAARAALARDVAFGLPGAADNSSLPDVRARLADHADISADDLRANLVEFPGRVVSVAEELGMRLCCHPDDPPFPLLGLHRIMSTEDDYAKIMTAVLCPASGITLCTGSLGARSDNDRPGMIDRLGDRIHYLQLHNVAREADGIPGSFQRRIISVVTRIWSPSSPPSCGRNAAAATPGGPTPPSPSAPITGRTYSTTRRATGLLLDRAAEGARRIAWRHRSAFPPRGLRTIRLIDNTPVSAF